MPEGKKTLGILGGLGPLASVYFYGLVTSHTKAGCDQDHLDIIVVSGASTPDRTDFITGKSKVSPLSAMRSSLKKLISAGAEVIAVPCNTATYFFDELQKDSPVPVMNIVRETAIHAKSKGAKRLGILATEGTVLSGSYERECSHLGMEYVVPSKAGQQALMGIIYDSIKKSAPPDTDAFNRISSELFSFGCDHIVLGCTELSLIPLDGTNNKDRIIDSLSVLAKNAITLCGAVPTGFDDIYNT